MPNPSKNKYLTPRVPIETPMFDGPEDVVGALGRVHRTWIIFWERIKKHAVEEAGEKKATFGLVKTLTVEDDLTLHYICRRGGAFRDLAVKAKIAPTGSAARIEIEKSTDEGATWSTIFVAPGYVTLAAGDTTRQDFVHTDATPIFAGGAAGTIEKGDLLRINCTQIGSTVAGAQIEFVLRWD